MRPLKGGESRPSPAKPGSIGKPRRRKGAPGCNIVRISGSQATFALGCRKGRRGGAVRRRLAVSARWEGGKAIRQRRGKIETAKRRGRRNDRGRQNGGKAARGKSERPREERRMAETARTQRRRTQRRRTQTRRYAETQRRREDGRGGRGDGGWKRREMERSERWEAEGDCGAGGRGFLVARSGLATVGGDLSGGGSYLLRLRRTRGHCGGGDARMCLPLAAGSGLARWAAPEARRCLPWRR